LRNKIADYERFDHSGDQEWKIVKNVKLIVFE
jgi:hypothetical protein